MSQLTRRDDYQESVRARLAEWRARNSETPAPAAPARTRGRRPTVRAPEPSGPPIVALRTYVVRPGRRQEFLHVMGMMAELLAAPLREADGRRDLVEDLARPGVFLEVVRLPGDSARARWDQWIVESRKIAGLEGLLDDLLDAARCDLRHYVAPQPGEPPKAAPSP